MLKREGQGPHPATVAQAKPAFGAAPAKRPHPATVAQAKAAFGASSARSPHPATLSRAGSTVGRTASGDALIQLSQKKGKKQGKSTDETKGKKPKQEKNKRSKVLARDSFKSDYQPDPTRVDTRFAAYTSAEITQTNIDEKHFLNFTVNGVVGHITLKPSYTLAHVTIAYGGGRLVNYYFEVADRGTIKDPEGRYVSGGTTEKFISNLPTEIAKPIRDMLEDIYD